jgi:hypothetical protein
MADRMIYRKVSSGGAEKASCKPSCFHTACKNVSHRMREEKASAEISGEGEGKAGSDSRSQHACGGVIARN